MNKPLVFRLLGWMLLMEAALMLPSLLVAFLYGEGDAPAILLTIGVTAIGGGALAVCLRPRSRDLTVRDGLAVAGLSWVVLSVFGALPFLLSGVLTNPVDAIFESVSGFTTTGSTILTDIEVLPHGILFWRSFTHWVGGMGVLVFTLALLPRLSGRTSHLARAESPGPTFSKLAPRMGDTAKMLYAMYIALSLLMVGCLLLAGMNVFDAFIHMFGTAGTGGFSNYNASVGAFQSPAVEWIIGTFMLLFGINFVMYFHIIRREARLCLKNEELWVYLGIAAAAVAVMTALVARNGRPLGEALRLAYFQTASIMSTTGFATTDYGLWPVAARALLVLLTAIGACAGSTAGGFKISRLVLLVKSGLREISCTLFPHKVAVIRLEGKPMTDATLQHLGMFLFLYLGLVLGGGVLLSFDAPDTTTAFTAALTCIANVGPGFGAIGPAGNFAFFSMPSKLFLSFLMLAGRLEILPMLVLFSPKLWRK